MGGSDSALAKGLIPDLRCHPPVERMTPDVSSWTCPKSPMPRYSWSRAARKNCERIIGIDPQCVRPVALEQHAHEIYVAHAAIPDESGFSQADLADLLEQTKKQVSDLEQITGTITQSGISLQCVGKGGRASGRLVFGPDQSSDLKAILHHTVEDFHLELPGPSWLVGLLVSRDAIETSIRTGLRDLAHEIDARLRLRAIELFTDQAQTTDPDVWRQAGQHSFTDTGTSPIPCCGRSKRSKQRRPSNHR